ncbi:MAG TPA: DUF4430 domain-containing protein [Candidatus Paceibacterota bacterium]
MRRIPRVWVLVAVLIALVAALFVVLAASKSVDSAAENAPAASEAATTTPEGASSPESSPGAAPRTAIVKETGANVAEPTALKTAAADAATAETASLVVSGTQHSLTAPAGATLETALDTLMAQGGFSYKKRVHQGLGSFVTEINGRAGDGDHYWILYVNGVKSPTGISATRIRSSDRFEWKLETSY